MKPVAFNGEDSIHLPKKAPKQAKNIPNPFPKWALVSLRRWSNMPQFSSRTKEETEAMVMQFTYNVIWYKYKKNGKLVYKLEPSLFNDSEYWRKAFREIEDSVKLDIRNEQNKKRTSREDFASNPFEVKITA